VGENGDKAGVACGQVGMAIIHAGEGFFHVGDRKTFRVFHQRLEGFVLNGSIVARVAIVCAIQERYSMGFRNVPAAQALSGFGGGIIRRVSSEILIQSEP